MECRPKADPSQTKFDMGLGHFRQGYHVFYQLWH
jgi:hypothetical protein